MAEREKNRELFPGPVNGLSRDLLRGFMNGNEFSGRVGEEKNNGEEGEGGLELSLGLSLNGKFGVDRKTTKTTTKLVRSSSVSPYMYGGEVTQAARVVPIAAYAPLTRTCSLPAETEEECRKRKELQSFRRMEAKRRRMEKLKNLRGAGVDKVDPEENSSEENGSTIDSNGQDSVNNSANGNANGLPLLQGSTGSQGSGSSGLSELESQQQPIQAVKQNNEAGSPSTLPYEALRNKQKAANSPSVTAENLGVDKGAKEAKDKIKNAMLNMPCVSTIGDGPNGKKVAGFLYRYGKGEEVSILCVCHGSFLSPAEFVRHGGGGDVEHPLRHIVVNSSPFL